jgi:Glycosyltransferase like family
VTQTKAVASRLHVVAAVNDEEVLENNLMRSPIIADGRVSLNCYRGASSASEAYNRGLDETTADIVVFAHQDVFLPEGWEANLERALSKIEASDPNWAVIGAWGIGEDGTYSGHAWSSGLNKRLGAKFETPVETACVDEFVIILRCDSGLRFDPDLPGFHLYAADIVLSGRKAGLQSYVANIPAIHNSKPVQTYSGGYSDAWFFMRQKWQDFLPIPTLTVKLTRSVYPLLRARLRLWRSRRRRLANARNPEIDPRELVSQLDGET